MKKTTTTKRNPLLTPAFSEAVTQVVSKNFEFDYDPDVAAESIKDSKTAQATIADVLATNPRILNAATAAANGVANYVATSVAAEAAETAAASAMATLVGELKSHITSLVKSGDRAAAIKIASALGSAEGHSGIAARVLPFVTPGKSIKPQLICGEQGAGKTYCARSLAPLFDVYIECPCFNGMESKDFVGGFLPDGKGGLKWVDSYLARAWRAAASGKTVLLLVDELLRVRRREREIFLTSLSPTAEGTYRLPTERPVEGSLMDENETLECPVNMLSIIGTTNIGAQFDVSDDDPAGRERWTRHYVYVTADSIRSALGDTLAARGFVADASKFIQFWTESDALHKAGIITMKPTVRTLCDAVRFAENDSPEGFANALVHLVPTWVGTDLEGRVNREQVQQVMALISSTFATPTITPSC